MLAELDAIDHDATAELMRTSQGQTVTILLLCCMPSLSQKVRGWYLDSFEDLVQ